MLRVGALETEHVDLDDFCGLENNYVNMIVVRKILTQIHLFIAC